MDKARASQGLAGADLMPEIAETRLRKISVCLFVGFFVCLSVNLRDSCSQVAMLSDLRQAHRPLWLQAFARASAAFAPGLDYLGPSWI